MPLERGTFTRSVVTCFCVEVNLTTISDYVRSYFRFALTIYMGQEK